MSRYSKLPVALVQERNHGDAEANLAVIETKSAGELLFRQQVGGVWLASPIQIYLDLLRGEGRAKEMAEHLRREKIGF